jgi:MscS family membrane protein
MPPSMSLQDSVQIYLSFYLEAANRDAFMAIKQDLLVSFVECVEKHGGKLATPRIVVSALVIQNSVHTQV